MDLHSTPWPITYADLLATRDRLAPYLTPTPLRTYPLRDELIGGGTTLFVKHDNHQPTCSFKVRNGLSFVTGLSAEERRRGIVAASTGNHGQGIAYAAHRLGVQVTVCVPVGNNPEKSAAMRGWGATVIEEGQDTMNRSTQCCESPSVTEKWWRTPPTIHGSSAAPAPWRSRYSNNQGDSMPW